MARATPRQRSDSLLGFACELQARHEASTTADERKARGQVFTPPLVCRFMAGLFSPPGESFRLLDPGAGVGSLTAAACDRFLALRSPRRFDFCLFETDSALIPLLKSLTRRCAQALKAAGHEVAFEIREEDFILGKSVHRNQVSLFEQAEDLGDFDGAIMNPPYHKIRGDSDYAVAMSPVVHGQPNVYSLFLAQGAQLLRPGGQLVAITPRSFCNGLYFREFRRWFFRRMDLRRIHVFESRKETFRDVLQESVVTKTRRAEKQSPSIAVSSSLARELDRSVERIDLPTEDVLDAYAGDMVVRIPTSMMDAAVIELAHTWSSRFSDLGLRISTGPVVEFRARQFLLREGGAEAIPLISIHNVRPFRTEWPLENGRPKSFRACADSMRLLVPTRNYVLLRRFSAKEERRRLVASPLLASELRGSHRALENHLNYVYHVERELTDDEAVGLTALFNSELLDRYFRTFSGNTQVNATEIRTMPFPDLLSATRIGKRVRRLKGLPSPKAETVSTLCTSSVGQGFRPSVFASDAPNAKRLDDGGDLQVFLR